MSFTKEQLLPGEELVILARQHPLVLFRPAVLSVLVLTLSLVFQKLWILAFLVPVLVYFGCRLLAWRRREYVLTDRRVVRQEGVFSISSIDSPLDKINNVFHNQSLLGRLLRYGDVGLETASEQGTTVFTFLSDPLAFKNAIVRERERCGADHERYRAPRQSDAPQNEIPKMIEDLASLRDRKILSESEFQEKKKSLLQKM